MITKSVAVSGTVGKQVYTSAQRVKLLGFLVRAATGVTATVTIREGNASGNIVADVIVPSNNSHDFHLSHDGGLRFDQGMHVKVIGASAVAYLYIN